MKPILVCAAALLLVALAPHAEAEPETCETGGTADVDTRCRKDPFTCEVHVYTQVSGSHCILRHA